VVLHFGVLRVCDPLTYIGFGGILDLSWSPSLFLYYWSHLHITAVSVHQQFCVGDFEFTRRFACLISDVGCVFMGMK
jgi:hypothetical protein